MQRKKGVFVLIDIVLDHANVAAIKRCVYPQENKKIKIRKKITGAIGRLVMFSLLPSRIHIRVEVSSRGKWLEP